MNSILEKRLPELLDLQNLIEKVKPYGRVETLAEIPHKNFTLPLYGIEIGCKDPEAPCLAIVAGVHGLERIGTLVALSALRTITELLTWDKSLHYRLEKSRLLFVPLMNPVGMFRRSRSNGNNIDLMRNSPVFSQEARGYLYSGHRWTPKLPFYRGSLAEEMELENRALCKFLQERLFPSKTAVSLDVHSGFGSKDRLWFPYAHTKKPFPDFVEAYAFRELLNKTYPNNFYSIEPQSLQYTTHGDVWDYLYESFRSSRKEGQYFLPLTLEMGSWKWVKKNPKQIFDLLGVYNPILPHRRRRVLRDHKTFIDFLHRTVLSDDWIDLPKEKRQIYKFEALSLWYRGQEP